jgi:hypothetical protein
MSEKRTKELLEKYRTDNLDLGNILNRIDYVQHGLAFLDLEGLKRMAVDSMVNSLKDAREFVVREIARQKAEKK